MPAAALAAMPAFVFTAVSTSVSSTAAPDLHASAFRAQAAPSIAPRVTMLAMTIRHAWQELMTSSGLGFGAAFFAAGLFVPSSFASPFGASLAFSAPAGFFSSPAIPGGGRPGRTDGALLVPT